MSMFSERDHVQFRVLTDGAEFVWRGARWMLQSGHVTLRVTGDASGPGPSLDLQPKPTTRVIVTRKSGFGKLEQSLDEKRRIEKENSFWQSRDERALAKARVAREREAVVSDGG